ncbi:hypothetical protein [Ereboglobus luteus]|nr:hypothetical protein [Ereboglobus luteus]
MVKPAYIHGDGAAARYLGFADVQGRMFRIWAREMRIPFAIVGGRANYRIADLDAAWERAASKERVTDRSFALPAPPRLRFVRGRP